MSDAARRLAALVPRVVVNRDPKNCDGTGCAICWGPQGVDGAAPPGAPNVYRVTALGGPLDGADLFRICERHGAGRALDDAVYGVMLEAVECGYIDAQMMLHGMRSL